MLNHPEIYLSPKLPNSPLSYDKSFLPDCGQDTIAWRKSECIFVWMRVVVTLELCLYSLFLYIQYLYLVVNCILFITICPRSLKKPLFLCFIYLSFSYPFSSLQGVNSMFQVFLTGNNSEYFTISPTAVQGRADIRVRVALPLDYEYIRSYSFSVSFNLVKRVLTVCILTFTWESECWWMDFSPWDSEKNHRLREWAEWMYSKTFSIIVSLYKTDLLDIYKVE